MKKLGIASSMAEAAMRTGLTLDVVKALKKLGHPAFVGSRVNCDSLDGPDMKGWLEKVPDDPKSENWRLRNEKLRREIGELDRKLISRDTVAARLAALCALVDAELKQKLTVEWPRAGQGMPSDELQKMGVDFFNGIVAKFRAFAGEWK